MLYKVLYYIIIATVHRKPPSHPPPEKIPRCFGTACFLKKAKLPSTLFNRYRQLLQKNPYQYNEICVVKKENKEMVALFVLLT